jgi:hypothetical protein
MLVWLMRPLFCLDSCQVRCAQAPLQGEARDGTAASGWGLQDELETLSTKRIVQHAANLLLPTYRSMWWDVQITV